MGITDTITDTTADTIDATVADLLLNYAAPKERSGST